METIKTIRMVRQIRDAQYALTKDMGDEEFVSYVRKKAKLTNDQAYEFIKTNSRPENHAPQLGATKGRQSLDRKIPPAPELG